MSKLPCWDVLGRRPATVPVSVTIFDVLRGKKYST